MTIRELMDGIEMLDLVLPSSSGNTSGRRRRGNFTDMKLDFIINHDIKYRMEKETNTYDE